MHPPADSFIEDSSGGGGYGDGDEVGTMDLFKVEGRERAGSNRPATRLARFGSQSGLLGDREFVRTRSIRKSPMASPKRAVVPALGAILWKASPGGIGLGGVLDPPMQLWSRREVETPGRSTRLESRMEKDIWWPTGKTIKPPPRSSPVLCVSLIPGEPTVLPSAAAPFITGVVPLTLSRP
jgi:hypothetical protein